MPERKKDGNFASTDRSMMGAMCGLQLKDGKGAEDLMLMLGLKGAIDWLSMVNSVHWYGHVLRRVNDH